MKHPFSRFFRRFSLLALALTLQLSAAPTETPVRLVGHVPTQAVSDAVLLQTTDPKVHLPLTFVLPLRNKEELEELVQRIYDPTDEQHYGKYLTAEEFTERFAPTQEDYDQVIAYAKSVGLKVLGTHSNRTLLNVSGPTRSIQKAFKLRLHHYQKPNGQTFHAPDNDPEVPSAIASIIHGVVGLDNHAVRHTYHRQKQAAEGILTANATSHEYPSGPEGGYAPKDLLTAYDLTGVSANGSDQIIALFELGSYLTSDITEYAKYFRLPSPKLHNILVDGGSTSGIDAEVTLDIELALALAPESQIYVYEGPNTDQGVLDTYNRIATDNLAKQVSTSWGSGESSVNAQYLQAESAIFLQMAAHGQTIYAAAGDSGAYDNYPSKVLMVDDPASQPYVVGVGGTRLTVDSNSGAYSNESIWNDGLGNGAGGGGVSSYWPLPSWQSNIATVYSTTHRNVPDVALNADPETGYSIYYNGQWTTYGGTSCAAPLWAAFTACINQARVANQQPVLGFANPLLYAIGKGASYTTNFHDITSGNNLYYPAKKGYDNASGWGSFNGGNLFASLTNQLPPPPPPAEVSVLNILMKHTGPFTKGETGTYKIVVSNKGTGTTSGAVTVSITLPKGLTIHSLGGTGWTFDETTLTCTQNSALPAGASYPTITAVVNVGFDAAHSVVPTAAVSGGGSTLAKMTTDLTTVR